MVDKGYNKHMKINLYDILEEQLLVEDRAAKIQGKVRRIIAASSPNEDWGRVVSNQNGNDVTYLQYVCNAFTSWMFGYGFSDCNMELAPHAAEIAFGELGYLENPNSREVNFLKNVVRYISKNGDKTYIERFNASDYRTLVSDYSKVLDDENAEKRNASSMVASNGGGYNGYTIYQIDTFDESKEFYKYTKDLGTPWCLTHMRDMFNSYGENGKHKIYFISHEGFENVAMVADKEPSWNVPKKGEAPYDEYGYSLICIIVDEDGNMTYCTPRWNHVYSHVDDFLDESEVSQLIGADFYSVFTPYTEEEIREREESGEFGEEDWGEYCIFSPNGYELGYFKDGVLYDMDREELNDGYYDSWSALKIGNGGLTIEKAHNAECDIYIIRRGSLELRFEGVKYYEVIDDYCGRDEMGIILGLDKDNDFVVANLDTGYSEYLRGPYVSFEQIAGEVYLLKDLDKEGYYEIVNWNNDYMDLYYGQIDPDSVEVEDEEVFFTMMGFDGVARRVKMSIYGGEIKDADDENVQESIERKNVLKEFKDMSERLDDIHRRNSHSLFD